MGDLETEFLQACREGDLPKLEALLKGSPQIDINCKGKRKRDLGWSGAHLASYFGHYDPLKLLLDSGAMVNSLNDSGDTPLHKAALIDRQDVVLLLLERNADVSLLNGDGAKARELCVPGGETERLLIAAESNEIRKAELALISAAKENDIAALNAMLKGERAPNINSVDGQGNTCLHCAAYRGHKQLAVILLQNGIDSAIRNIAGQRAVDLAKDKQMREVLSVRPVRELQRSAPRLEGQLLKKSRFLGWKPLWVVLERGVLTYFTSRGDASSGVKRRDFKYLDGGAKAGPIELAASAFLIAFSDGTTHTLAAPLAASDPTGEINRQKWLSGIAEHIAWSSHYLGQGQGCGRATAGDSSDEDEECKVKPLGSMQDSLKTADAKLRLFETRLKEISSICKIPLPASDPLSERLASSIKKFEEVCESGSSVLSSLSHCLNLIKQQEEVRGLQLKEEREKCRVLEEALAVLAKEHHELEQSISRSSSRSTITMCVSPRFYDTSEDEFYDAFEPGVRSEENSLASALSDDSDTLSASSLASFVSFATNHNLHFGCSEAVEGGAEHDPPSTMEQPSFQHRECLPVGMFSRNDFSIWSVLKNCIGKELSKITMPVVFNEPLSFLQRIVEYMEYSQLLDCAAQQSDPALRMQYICAFAVSALASNWERLGKPFNPLLGETYQLERENFRVLCEQVSHHPPVSAFHASSDNFVFHGSIQPKLKFWGKSVEIQPKGTVTLQLPRWGEVYTWSNVNCCVHNIIVGKLWIEQYGTMEIVNHNTGMRAVLTFKPAGWFSKDLHRVEGFLIDPSKKKLNFMYGKWTEFMKVTDVDSYEEYLKENLHKFRRGEGGGGAGAESSPAHTPKKVLAKLKVGFKSQNSISEGGSGQPEEGEFDDVPKSDSTYSIDIPNSNVLWQALPRPDNTSQYYQFTLFAMSLNELEPGMERRLCPTDSRLRPDIRKLEEGDLDGAAAEKNRLEEKQRESRKSRKKGRGGSGEWAPRWFKQSTHPQTGAEDWLYQGGFWEASPHQDPHIF